MVHRIYEIASPLPQVDCVFFLLTIRARNLFLNGLFNDPFQTLFSYLGVLYLLRRRYTASLMFFSLGASVKMSGLLWAPGVAAYLLSTIGLIRTLQASWAGVLVQVLVAIPFRGHLWLYIHRSFELDRQFTWFNVPPHLRHDSSYTNLSSQTLNWKFLPPEIFYSRTFSILLLSLHIIFAALFIRRLQPPRTPFSTLTLLSTTLFSGIAFSRSLHYSFYIWYFHLIPFLLRLGGLGLPARVAVALGFEWAWNQWQSYKAHDEFNSCATWWGSAGMVVLHFFVLWRLYGNVGREYKDKNGRVLG